MRHPNTNSDRLFCRIYLYPSGIVDDGCVSTTVEEVESVYFTYKGQKCPNLSTVTLTDGASEGLGDSVTVTVQKKVTGSPSAVTFYVIPSGQLNMAHSVNQNQYPYHPQQHRPVPPYTNPSMVSPTPLDARMSMMTGSVSPSGQNAHGGGGQLSPSLVQNPAPDYEMAGSEAREPEPVYEMGGDSPGRK